MKISDYKGEDALEVLADVIDPVMEILGDNELRDMVRGDKEKLLIVKRLLKEHRKQIIEIMARLDGEDPETYKPTIFKMTANVLGILNDPEVKQLFTSQSQSEED